MLVIGASIGIYKPSELVLRSNEISDYISSSAISRVLIGNNELINHVILLNELDASQLSKDIIKHLATFNFD